MGSRLRNIASGKFYMEMDDRAVFHKLTQARTGNAAAKELIERIVSDGSLKAELSQHYFGEPGREEDIKPLLHSVSNGGSPAEWQRERVLSRPDHGFIVDLEHAMAQVTREFAETGSGPQAVALISARFPTKKKRVLDPSSPSGYKEIEAPRDPARCWKSYLLQSDEAKGLLAKITEAQRQRLSIGPPLHDGLFVQRS